MRNEPISGRGFFVVEHLPRTVPHDKEFPAPVSRMLAPPCHRVYQVTPSLTTLAAICPQGSRFVAES